MGESGKVGMSKVNVDECGDYRGRGAQEEENSGCAATGREHVWCWLQRPRRKEKKASVPRFRDRTMSAVFQRQIGKR